MRKRREDESKNEKEGERENESGWARESQTNKCRSRTLAFGIARPVSETRRFNQRAKKSRVAEKRQSERERKTEGERKRGWRERQEREREEKRERRGEAGLTLKYVDPRATLGLFSLHPAERFGRIPVRHAGRESVYRMIQKHRIIFLSLWTEARSLSPSRRLLLLTLLLREAPAGM